MDEYALLYGLPGCVCVVDPRLQFTDDETAYAVFLDGKLIGAGLIGSDPLMGRAAHPFTHPTPLDTMQIACVLRTFNLTGRIVRQLFLTPKQSWTPSLPTRPLETNR